VTGAGPVDVGAGPPWPGGAAWIDGRYAPIEAAKISVLDLGVTRSDCTYDVAHVWEGRFFRLDAHLDRFAASMARLRLDPAYDRAQIEAIRHGCVRHAGLRQAYVSMTCTRGTPPRSAATSRADDPAALPWKCSSTRERHDAASKMIDFVQSCGELMVEGPGGVGRG
jgi:branched-subunit amino acid aminotransferase/4-amino-4-deoxychorismate lyase